MMNLTQAYPEIFLVVAASVILLIDMFLSDGKRYITYVLSILALATCAGLSLMLYKEGATVYLFNNMFVSDPMSDLLKLFSYGAVALTLVYSRKYSSERGMLGGNLGGEFYVLALFAMLGQMVMISGNNFLVIYLGLELMSLALYALVALRRDHTPSTEASMKYFILGALASGFLLYGMSMLYGATGSLDIQQVLLAAQSGAVKPILLVFGIVFIVAGLGFKLGAVPFHMWVPDVYQGAPTGVTLLLGAAPKLATFAICIRLLAEGLFPEVQYWQQMLIVLAVLSMTIGNLTAIAQTNLKRMLAYSTIAQMGFMLLGLLSGAVGTPSQHYDFASQPYVANAYGAAMFYSITYVMTTLGTFGVILLLSRSGFEAENIDDLKGLNQRSPWFAFIMALLMFSLAGIPPLMGFYAKLTVLGAVVEAHQTWLAVYAVMMSLIGAYYYLRVVKVMYFDEASDKSPINANLDMRIILSLNGLAALALGLMPGSLMSALRQRHSQNFVDLNMDDHLKETKIDGKLAYDGSFLKVQRDTVSLPDGKPTIREYIRHPGAVVILPLFDDGKVLLERQYRYPNDQVFIEFPAGKFDPNEEALACAKRELLEETGYTATEWHYLCTIHNAIAYSDEHLDIFLARGLVAGERKLDEGEFLDVIETPLTELMDWVKEGKVTDVKTVIGAFWLDKIVSGQWKP